MATPNFAAIRTWIANTATGADASIRGASTYPVDTIPGTPWFVVGPVGSQGDIEILHGSWERMHLPFHCRLYVARLADSTRTQQVLEPILSNLMAAFRAGGTESGTVSSSLLDTIKTGLFEDLGSERYEVCDCVVNIVFTDATQYTP